MHSTLLCWGIRIKTENQFFTSSHSLPISCAVSVQTFAALLPLFSCGFSLCVPACSVPAVISTPVAILYQCSFNNRTEFQTEVPLLNIFLYFTIFWLCTKCSRWYSLESVFTKAIIVGLRLLCPCRSVLLVEIMVDKRRVIIVYRQGGIIQSGQQVRSDITDI